MTRTILTAARVEALKPRKTTRDIRDAKLRGFSVRVSPAASYVKFVRAMPRRAR